MKKILIVEDDKMNQKLFDLLLTKNGFQTRISDDGNNIVDVIKDYNPNLILMDINLPTYSGVELLQIIRSDNDTKHYKIIALTAYAMYGDREKFMSAGFDFYIKKPIDINHFITTITDMVNERAIDTECQNTT